MLYVTVFDKVADLYRSQIWKRFRMEYHYHMSTEDGECPSMEIVDFHKGKVLYAEYGSEKHVFIQGQLASKELGRIEHCIFNLTGLRGDAIKVSGLEFLVSPNTPLKKFLLRRT